jgi:3-phenylpropionate/cinnamic acid dioxygenase small subunit
MESSKIMGGAKGVLRRDLLKAAGVVGLGALSVGSLSACAPSGGGGVQGDTFAALSDVLVRYCTGIDSKDWELFRTVWTDDVDADYGDDIGHWTSGDEITSWMENAHKDMGYTMHRVSNIRIDSQSGDEVNTRTYVDAVLYLQDGTLIANAKGFYDDVLVRTGDSYKIKKRLFTSVFQGSDSLDLTFDANLKELLEKQAIIDLQSDYWWYMDSKQWDKWRTVFADDLQYYQFGELAYESADDFCGNTSAQLQDFITAHQAHQNKIVITGPDTATARWILNDCLTIPSADQVMKGYGYYINDYAKVDGKWVIKVLRLGYFRFESGLPSGGATVSSEILYSSAATE